MKDGQIFQIDANGNYTGKRFLQDIFMQESQSDNLRTNNAFRRGTLKELMKAYEIWEKTGNIPTAGELGVSEGAAKNFARDIEYLATQDGLDFERASIEKRKAYNQTTDEETLNPYAAYVETQRQKEENAQYGLLKEQALAQRQNSDITAQQSMMNQASLKDQIIEQIKLDRLSKMREGITPMQIANENLQLISANMQANNTEMTMANQSRLAATQQLKQSPYQAYINSVNGTGYQVNANLGSGLAATDASSLYQQALMYARSQGRNSVTQEDMDKVKA